MIIGKGVKTIGEGAFDQCLELKKVYYAGGRSEWKSISVGENNSYFTNARVYFDYSEEEIYWGLFAPLFVFDRIFFRCVKVFLLHFFLFCLLEE